MAIDKEHELPVDSREHASEEKPQQERFSMGTYKAKMMERFRAYYPREKGYTHPQHPRSTGTRR
jgi:hypothetical protein